MSIESLKEKARRHEQDEEWEQALELYLEAIETLESEDDYDVSLYNRVGDLEVRLGRVDRAVEHYEAAVDLYVESELPNNAIAICKKVARNLPERDSTFLRMGQIRARQGFLTDARQNFLTYAERKQSAGDLEEAFRALIEFVELVPEDTEIRLALAEQLAQHDRGEEAVEQFREARRLLALEGEDERVEELEARIRELDGDAALAPPEELRSGPDEAVAGAAAAAAGGALPDLSAASPDDSSGAAGSVGDSEAEAEDGPVPDGAGDGSGVGDGEEPEPGPRGAPSDDMGGRDEETREDAPEEAPEAGSLEGLERFGFAVEDDDAPEAATPSAPADDPGLGSGGEPDAVEEPEPEGTGETEGEVAADGIPLLEGEGTGEADDAGEAGEAEEEAERGDAAEPAADPLPMMYFDGEEEDESEPAGASGPDGDDTLDAAAPAEEARESAFEEAASAGDSWLSEVDESGGGPEEELLEEELPEEELLEEEPPEEEPPERRPVGGEDEAAAPPAGQGADVADPEALRSRAERLLARGDDEGLVLLERAQEALAEAGEPEEAVAVMRRIARERPADVELRQRMVEYAYRTGDDDVLVTAYLDLADALRRSGDVDRARSVYEQALDADSGNEEAREALTELSGGEAPSRRREVASSEEYVDLGSLVLEEEEKESSTRFVVPAEAPTGDEQADFARMLDQFKEKVAENVSTDDVAAHYDLGTAYREMGLVDEAIAEFQAALRADRAHLPTYEMLGQCFLETGRGDAAVRTLERALEAPHEVEDELLGIHYYLGRAHEEMGRKERALDHYEKVFALDINFMDVTERLRALR